MRPEDMMVLRGLPLLSGMADSCFEALLQSAYLQTFPPGVVLFREGERSDFLFVPVDGHVELFASWRDRETTMSMVGPAEPFILAAVIKDAAYLMSARTTDRSRILMVPSDEVRRAFREDDVFARAIGDELAGCYRQVVRSQKDLKLRSSVERLAAYLLQLHEEAGGTTSVPLELEKRTIAALLGMTPENLSRAFATLRPYGVTVQGPMATLSDLPSLMSLAKPTPLIDGRSV